MMHGCMNGMGIMSIFGALLLAGLILLGVVLVKSLSGSSTTVGGPGTTVDGDSGSGRGREILEERYARGELSAEEYREMRRTLEGEDG